MKGVLLIDTNLLVLFVVGTAAKEYIAKHKKLTEFTVEDYDLLVKLIARASEVLVTPNTLTETSNLAAYIGEPARSKVMDVLRRVSTGSQERYVPSSAAARRSEFIRLGLADAALLEATAAEKATLLTADFNLYHAALAKGSQALNFNHLRDQYM
uniref:PIN domain-containing protein n=1 Tax=Candidatus Electronema sp. TaxID=2698783 RepID=UPI0040571396